MVQEKIADSWVEIEQFRLLVLRTAWLIDKHQDYKRVLKDIAAVTTGIPEGPHEVAGRTLQLHRLIGLSEEMPFGQKMVDFFMLGVDREPTEGPKVNLAKQ